MARDEKTSKRSPLTDEELAEAGSTREEYESYLRFADELGDSHDDPTPDHLEFCPAVAPYVVGLIENGHDHRFFYDPETEGRLRDDHGNYLVYRLSSDELADLSGKAFNDRMAYVMGIEISALGVPYDRFAPFTGASQQRLIED